MKIGMRMITMFGVLMAPSLLAAPPHSRQLLPQVEVMHARHAAPNFNQLVLNAIKKMPKGGGYAVSRAASAGLSRSMVVREGGELVVNAKHAQPSYCSGATFLVFLYAIKEAERNKYLRVDPAAAWSLRARGQQDGVGVWGRWNANGPGTASLFHETKLGRNYESYADARPGDFMKIFWSDEIGAKEFGHSVVFLSVYQKKGVKMVKFWSSNKPGGYGEKSVPISKIKWAIFSRVTDISKINQLHRIKQKDTFLASMLTKSYTRAQIRKKVGMKKVSGRKFLGL